MSDWKANLQVVRFLILLGLIALMDPPLTLNKVLIAYVVVGVLRLILRTKAPYSEPIEPTK